MCNLSQQAQTVVSFFDLDSHVCTRYYSDASLLVQTPHYPVTVETLYKNIGHKNNLVWKNIFPRRENFVSDLRIISLLRIFLGIIDLFLYPDSQTHDLPLP